MIRLAVMSDLHVEKGDYQPPPFTADLVVLAGDIGWGLDGIAWIARSLGGRPVVLVPGNREHWHHPPGTDPLAALRRAAAVVPGLTLLQDEVAEFDIGGRRLRVLGCTLWGEFALDGDPAAAAAEAATRMPDYRHGRGPHGGPLTPADTLAASRASAAFLAAELAKPHAHSPDGPTLVLTHHLPSLGSLERRKPGNLPQAGSVTELDGLIATHGPALWVHGHSHWNCDWRLGATRMLAHQRGGPENEGFAPLLVTL